MQIKQDAQLQDILQKNAAFGFLYHGQDLGLVELKCKQLYNILAKQNPEKIRLSYTNVEENADLFFNEIFSFSLFSNKKIIEIVDAKEGFAKILQEVLKNLNPQILGNIFVVIKTENLAASSSLRKLFESEANLCSIACYSEDERTLITFAKDYLNKAGINIDADGVQYLIYCCKGNKLILQTYLQQIELFKAFDENKNINLESLQPLISNLSEFNYYDLVKAVFDKNYLTLFSLLKKAYSEGVQGVSIVRAFANYFRRIYLVITSVQNGASQQSAIESLYPKVFFKDLPIFQKHIATVKKNGNLPLIMQKLIETEIAIKEKNLDEVIVANLAFGLAQDLA